MKVLRSSHPEGKCTTAMLKPHQEALKRGPALLNGSQDPPKTDTAGTQSLATVGARGAQPIISLPPTKGQNLPFLKGAFRLEQKEEILYRRCFEPS